MEDVDLIINERKEYLKKQIEDLSLMLKEVENLEKNIENHQKNKKIFLSGASS